MLSETNSLNTLLTVCCKSSESLSNSTRIHKAHRLMWTCENTPLRSHHFARSGRPTFEHCIAAFCLTKFQHVLERYKWSTLCLTSSVFFICTASRANPTQPAPPPNRIGECGQSVRVGHWPDWTNVPCPAESISRAAPSHMFWLGYKTKLFRDGLQMELLRQF